MSQGLRKRIRKGLEYTLAQGAGVVAEGFFENPLLASAVSTGTYFVESQIDDYLFPDYAPPQMAIKRKLYARANRHKRKAVRYAARVPRLLNRTNVEVKHYDLYTNNALAINNAYTITSLPCTPVQGLDSLNRVGRKIKVISMDIQCQFGVAAPAQVYLTGDTIRCHVIRDNQTQGALAAANKIFDSVYLGAAQYQSPRLTETLKRFNILHSSDHQIVVQTISGTTVTSTANVPTMDVHLKLNDIIEFQSTGGTIADVVSKSYMCACSHLQGNVATSAYNVYFFTRWKFVDL